VNKSIIAGLLVLLFERFVQIISAIYANHLISKALPIEQFGIWQYAFTFSNILMSLTWMCGSESVVPQLSRYSLRKKLIYCNTIFFARLSVSSLVATVSVILAITAESEIVRYYLLFSSVTLLAREPLMVGFAKWQSEGKLYLSGIIQIFGCIIRILTLYYLFIVINFDIKFLALPWVLEGIFVAIVMYCCSICKFPRISLVRLNDIGFLLKRSFFIWGGVVAYALFMKIDRFLLKGNISPVDYGIYSAASQINENTASVTLILIQVLAPIQKQEVENFQQKSYCLIHNNVYCFFVILIFVKAIYTIYLYICFRP
jgi:PST family polysaccharide transporter